MRARDNPFRTDRVLSVRYKLQGVTWSVLLRRLEQLDYRAGIVGPHGAGKTTLLEDLEPMLVERGFTIKRLRLDEEHRAFDRGLLNSFCSELNQRDVILFDGAEQLSRWAWLKFRRRTRAAGGLIITSHRVGRLPTLIECRTTPRVLGEIVDEILNGEAHSIHDLVPELFRKHDGNLRLALRELYDFFAATGTGVSSSQSLFVSRHSGLDQIRSFPDSPPSSRKSGPTEYRTKESIQLVTHRFAVEVIGRERG
jgi:hypothetical protein